jgi:hypothetical protein
MSQLPSVEELGGQSIELCGRGAALLNPVFHLPFTQHMPQCKAATQSEDGQTRFVGSGQTGAHVEHNMTACLPATQFGRFFG